MRKVECIISPKKFIDLEKRLRDFGIHGLTVTEVKGYGNQQTRPESYLLLPKTKLEIYCHAEHVEDVIGIILSECKSGQMGDGKIVVSEVLDIIRIRTGERGGEAV